jgi:hypothetical protein
MTMTDVATPTTARRSRPPKRPRPETRIGKLRAEYPKATAEQLCELYKKWLIGVVIFDTDDDEAEIMTLIDLALRSLVKDHPAARLPKTPAQRQQAKAQKKALVNKIAAADEQRIETLLTVRLLEYQTTYGKRLADCTGAECKRLSFRYGSFFAEIAKRLSPSDRVGNHLSEPELQAIAKTHRLVGPEAVR